MAMAELKNARALQRKLEGFGWKIYNRWMKHAMVAGSRPIIRATRRAAPKDTGALKKSIGRRIKGYRRSMSVIAVIGPRSDFVAHRRTTGTARKYEFLRGGKAKAILKVAAPGRRRPSKYAHLVESGTKVRRIKNWFGRSGVTKWVGRMPASPFLEPAFKMRYPAALAAIVAKLREGIAAEARR